MINQFTNTANAQVMITMTQSDLEAFANNLVSNAIERYEAARSAHNNEEFLTTDEVAEMLSVNRSTLWRWEKRGYLMPIKIGAQVRYAKSAILEKLNNQ